ncbi:hypothetical protein PIB30_073560, partial [Stylosanthes scabra]|nr:hypothetical protein [Stylosanthes scabra]
SKHVRLRTLGTSERAERNPSFLCTPRMLWLARAAPLHSLAGKFADGNLLLSPSFRSVRSFSIPSFRRRSIPEISGGRREFL